MSATSGSQGLPSLWNTRTGIFCRIHGALGEMFGGAASGTPCNLISHTAALHMCISGSRRPPKFSSRAQCKGQMDVCSPSSAASFERSKTCFSKEALQRLVHAWNDAHPDARIPKRACRSKRSMWDALDERMHGVCNGSGREWCWVDKLPSAKASADVARSLRPAKPLQWYKQPHAWLSNYDIQAVMSQYQEDRTNAYKFIGVYPIDFQHKTAFGTCLFDEICAIDIARLAARGTRCLGMVINLDRHDQRGSHWTSLFACIDPSMPCFGAYYYDSTAPQHPPPEVVTFMQSLQQQAGLIPNSDRRTFRLACNKQRHQYGNSECGVFAIAYQIRWLDMLRSDPSTASFEAVASTDLRDATVHQMRDTLFRPNSRAVLQQPASATSRKKQTPPSLVVGGDDVNVQRSKRTARVSPVQELPRRCTQHRDGRPAAGGAAATSHGRNHAAPSRRTRPSARPQ